MMQGTRLLELPNCTHSHERDHAPCIITYQLGVARLLSSISVAGMGQI